MISYVLIQTRSGAASRVAEELRRGKVADSVDVVTGPYDVIAQVRSTDLTRADNGTAARIRSIDGVLHALVCHRGNQAYGQTNVLAQDGWIGEDPPRAGRSGHLPLQVPISDREGGSL